LGDVFSLQHQRDDIPARVEVLVKARRLQRALTSMPGIDTRTVRILTEVTGRSFASAAYLVF
jgi:hypothetical protein